MYENMKVEVFAERLRLIRDEKGFAQEELGKMAGLTKGTLSKYESGKNAPKIMHAKALANALHVSFCWLIGFSEDRYEVESYKLTDIYNKLTDQSKHELYNYAIYLLNKEPQQNTEEV